MTLKDILKKLDSIHNNGLIYENGKFEYNNQSKFS